jgi:hypothetical protein
VKVFISWSGEQSRQIAQALRDWLPMMFESVEPYMSARDNEAGIRWADVIAHQLDESSFGILCLTPTNLAAPWLLFEAGALSKSVDIARLVPLLWKVTTADVKSPLSQFHMKAADKSGIMDVIASVNALLERPRHEDVLASTFDLLWPRLEDKLLQIKPPTEEQSAATHRSNRELLEEILEIARTNSQERPNRPDRLHADPPTSLAARLEYEGRTLQGNRASFIAALPETVPPNFEWLAASEGDEVSVSLRPRIPDVDLNTKAMLDFKSRASTWGINVEVLPWHGSSGQ